MEALIWLREVLGVEDLPGSSRADLLEGVRRRVLRCTRCPLHQTRTNYVFGAGNPESKIMLVGEAPGRDEDILGKPFVGRAGAVLTEALASIGLERERDVYIANTLKCRPPRNRDPRPEELAACTPYLEAQIRIIRPRVLVALGRFAAAFLLGMPTERFSIRAHRGRLLESRYGIPLWVMYHPAATFRNAEARRLFFEDFRTFWHVVQERGLLS